MSLLLACMLAISAVRATASDSWPQEPSGFRGIPLGASEADVTKALAPVPPSCMSFHGERSCGTQQQIGDVRAKEEFGFADDRLVTAMIRFPAKDFSYMRDLFVEKYGAPKTEQKPIVRTRAGVEYENDILAWEGDNISIMLRRFGSTMYEGGAMFVDKKWSDEQARLRDEKKKKAASDF
jgi:hypothetical protein